jgi:anti-sigma factor ChrR (cupin superfamily)
MTPRELESLAAAAALGAHDLHDAARFEAALASDPQLQADAAAFRDAIAATAEALCAPAAPPAELRARILAAIAATPQVGSGSSAPAAPHGFHFLGKDEGEWIETGAPGFRVKILSGNGEGGPQVMFAQLVAGGRVPDHDHVGTEDLYMLSGHLQTEGRTLGPGDSLHAEPGTHHHELISPDGCTALLILGAPQTY